ncbi:MAG: ABC transporter permease [Peptostreptococcaceae bacterium]|nr:ABC transporter permease [Peptostreptococcaceae bacterium]
MIFVAICLICVQISQMTWGFIMNELVARLARNLFLVLSLIIPVVAGMGLNFSIVIGAMAGQIAIITVTHLGVPGIAGLALTTLITVPLAIIFGYLTGVILNKTRGQEMIAGMILGFFTNGLYQLLFLFLVGTLIPIKDPVLILSNGIGVKNTVDLHAMKYSLDKALDFIPFFKNLTFIQACIIISAVMIILYVYLFIKAKREERVEKYSNLISKIVVYTVILIGSFIITTQKTLINNVKFPAATFILVGLLCLFTSFIMKTKQGQDFRTVGQDMHIAEISGVNVSKTRIRAIIISTVLAAVGQLIFLQNMGILNTYGGHEQVGMYAIAAIVVGGASVTRATIGQAILGTALFHTLFIVSPQAGKNLFGDAQIGEYFRVFIAYGVIGLSLALYAWKQAKSKIKQ